MSVFFIHSTDVGNGVIRVTNPLLSHISKSLRTKLGDELLFNDDQGFRYHTTISQITKQTLQATIQQIESSPCSTCPPIVLGQALLKGEKMGWVIQKATELGIATIIPLTTDRVVPKLSVKQEETHRERWKRIAREAAQQSERWTLPAISPIQPFQTFLERSQQGLRILMAERLDAPSLLTLPYSNEQTDSGVTVLIGPEGGWSKEEIETAKSYQWAFASFGKGILRAETASLAALAILQARFNR